MNQTSLPSTIKGLIQVGCIVQIDDKGRYLEPKQGVVINKGGQCIIDVAFVEELEHGPDTWVEDFNTKNPGISIDLVHPTNMLAALRWLAGKLNLGSAPIPTVVCHLVPYSGAHDELILGSAWDIGGDENYHSFTGFPCGENRSTEISELRYVDSPGYAKAVTIITNWVADNIKS